MSVPRIPLSLRIIPSSLMSKELRVPSAAAESATMSPDRVRTEELIVAVVPPEKSVRLASQGLTRFASTGFPGTIHPDVSRAEVKNGRDTVVLPRLPRVSSYAYNPGLPKTLLFVINSVSSSDR